MSTTAVPFTGERTELDALKQLARERNTTVGKMVAAAIHAQYGAEMKPLISFFRKRDYDNSQVSKSETEHA